MKDLLLKTNNSVEEREQQGFLPQEELLQIEQEYTRIITEGIAYHAQLPLLPKGKRGKQKQRDGKNLLDRQRKPVLANAPRDPRHPLHFAAPLLQFLVVLAIDMNAVAAAFLRRIAG